MPQTTTQSTASPQTRAPFPALPLLAPENGVTVLEPGGVGPGFWAGAADVIFDSERHRFYLYARQRRPADPRDPEQRGSRCHIYESSDGVRFEPVWSAHHSEFDTVSMEKGSLVVLPDGRRRLYISYECPGGGGWQVDMLEAAAFSELDTSTARRAITPAMTGTRQVKDPIARVIDGRLHLYANYHAPTGGEAAGLAISEDFQTHTWKGRVLPGTHEAAWDYWGSRATGLMHLWETWYLFYDGAFELSENFEEQSGLAAGRTPHKFERLTPDGPLAEGEPRGPLSHLGGRFLPSVSGIRYVTPLLVGDRLLYYYEWTRPDGSHELRLTEHRIPPTG